MCHVAHFKVGNAMGVVAVHLSAGFAVRLREYDLHR